MAGTTDLVINILANNKTGTNLTKVSQEVKDVGKSAEFASSMLKSMGAALISYISIRTIKQAVEEFQKQEVAIVSLNSALKNAGYTSKVYSNQLQELAGNLQKVTVYGDEEIELMEAKLLTYGKTIDEVKKLTPFLVDLASKMSLNSGETVSLQQAYIAYAYALNGSERQLRRYGLNLDDATIKSRDVKKITDELSKSVKDAGVEFANTSMGGMKQYQNALGELREAIGSFVNSQWYKDFLYGLTGLIQSITPSTETPITKALDDLKKLSKSMPSLSDDFTTLQKQIGDLPDNTSAVQLRLWIKSLNQAIDSKNVAANAQNLAEYRYQLSLINKEVTDYISLENQKTDTNKQSKETQEALNGTIEETVILANELVQANRIGDLGLGVSTIDAVRANSEQMAAALEPLRQMSEIVGDNLTGLFMGNYSVSESFMNAGKQILSMLVQMIVKATIVKWLFQALGLITGALFGGGTQAVSAGISSGAGSSVVPTVPGGGGIGLNLNSLSPAQPSLNTVASQGGMTVINYNAPIPVASNREIAKDVIKIIDTQQKFNRRYTK